MEHQICLNCREMTTKNFCANCGQKVDTHRITLKHFIMHDLLHGVWHFERGILFTIKQTFLRPGKAALDYIQGRRVRYYNVFYLCLLVIAVDVLLYHFSQGSSATVQEDAHGKGAEVKVFFQTYGKQMLFSVVPLMSLNAWLLFRKLRLNLAEHLILGGVNLLGMLLLSVLFLTVSIFWAIAWMPEFIDFLLIGCFFAIPLFPLWCYYNATKGYYKFFGYFWRIVTFYGLFLFEIVALLAITLYLITGQTDVEISG